MSHASELIVVPPEGGEGLSFHGIRSRIPLDGKASGGRVCLTIGISGPGDLVRPHAHTFAEAFYLLDGEMTFRIGNARVTARAGDFVYLPPNVPHQPVNESGEEATLLTICLPAGFEQFQREVGATEDVERMTAIAANYGITFDLASDAFESSADYRFVRAGEGPAVGVVGDLYRFLATAGDTDGAFGLWHATVFPGGGPPPHLHRREHEVFFVLAGWLDFFDDGRPHRAGPGTLVFLPEGSRHWFRNTGSEPAEMLILVAPGGIEELFRRVGREWPDTARPVPMPDADEKQRMAAAASEFGIVLG